MLIMFFIPVEFILVFFILFALYNIFCMLGMAGISFGIILGNYECISFRKFILLIVFIEFISFLVVFLIGNYVFVKYYFVFIK